MDKKNATLKVFYFKNLKTNMLIFYCFLFSCALNLEVLFLLYSKVVENDDLDVHC